MANQANKSGDATACSPGDLSKTKVKETTFENTKLNLVKLNWKEVYYTNCPLVFASLAMIMFLLFLFCCSSPDQR